MKDVIIQGVKR